MRAVKVFFVLLCFIAGGKALTQVGQTFYEGERITSVKYVFENPPQDSLTAQNIELTVKRTFPVFPQMTVNNLLLEIYTNKVQNLESISKAEYEIFPSLLGGVEITLKVTISDQAKDQKSKNGLLVDGKGFPLLYQDNKSLLTTKIAIAQMLYTNNNAWYGRDDEMLKGNPLAHNPAGAGFTAWTEGWASGGLYGITTLSSKYNMYLYGGVNYIVSGSVGRELFTDKSRAYAALDDAYAGFLGTVNYPSGNRLTYNFSFGRQQFSVGKGFIIRNTASNGDNRAALQLNPRWASDYLGLAALRYNNFLFQVFQLNPDELPVVDSKTVIQGVNIEGGGLYSGQIGFVFLNIPQSTFSYYTPQGKVLGRDGLNLYNIRYYKHKSPGVSGLFYKGELAYERNSHFDMSAFAGYAEIGWNFAKSFGTPVLRYRFAYFSGDNPDTETYERWDPLLSGGNGEEWVLGANHFKIVQNSNMMVHQLQANIRPWKKIELVPQILYMVAAQQNNIGGNPALSYMPKKEYGIEFNISIKYFQSRRWYWHGHIAYTIPGAGVKEVLGNTKPWLSMMIFVRYGL